MATPPVVTPKPSGFVSFIKKLGSMFGHGAVKAIQIVQKDAPALEKIALVAGTIAGVGPEVLAVEGTFNRIFGEVVAVEQVATAVGASEGTGAQKLLAAIPQVEQVILSDPLFKGKTIADVAKWNDALAKLTGAIYDLANAVEAPTPIPVSPAPGQ